MKKRTSNFVPNSKNFTAEEISFGYIKSEKGEVFRQLRCRSIFISNKGRVISTDFQGRGYVRELNKIKDKSGYSVVVRRKEFNPNGERLHNLVAEVFLTNTDNCKTVRFIDGNHYNCNVENLYYYRGHKESANKKYPKDDIFEMSTWFPFSIGNIIVCASGIVVTSKKEKWDLEKRMRQLETMRITNVCKCLTGFSASVVDGGGSKSTLELKNGFLALKTSWGSCLTIKSMNQRIIEGIDLSIVLDSIKHFYAEFIETESPMSLVDIHIESMNFTMDYWDNVKVA